MRTIVIYHAPQECGSPYFMFINAKDGQVMQNVDVPDVSGYYDGGMEAVRVMEPTGRTAERRIETTRLPKVGEEYYDFSECRGFTPRKRRGGACFHRADCHWKVDSISDVSDDDRYVHTFKGVLHLVEYRVRTDFRYLHRSQDSYIAAMTEAGFDMTGWCQYKRRKTDYETFLHAMAKAYCKDYEIINFIRVW